MSIGGIKFIHPMKGEQLKMSPGESLAGSYSVTVKRNTHPEANSLVAMYQPSDHQVQECLHLLEARKPENVELMSMAIR